MNVSKHVEFRGSALDDLRAFPVLARREAGYQLDQVQQGGEADDWKPMNTVGAGGKYVFGMKRVRFAWSTLPNFPVRFTSCTAFRKRHNKPVKQTSTWQRNATGIYARSLNNEP